MLRRFHIARLALQHSPEREERLLSFAAVPPAAPTPEQRPDDAREHKDDVPTGVGFVLSERQQFHDALFNAIQPDDQRRVLDTYLPDIEKHLGKVEAPASNKDLDEVLQLARLSIVDELNREERERSILADAIRNIDTSTVTDDEIRAIFTANSTIIERYFKLSPAFDPSQAMNLLQGLLFKDIQRVQSREHERETGIKWTFLKKEEFEQLYRKIRNVPAGKDTRVPNAFSYGNTMYFDAESADFADPVNGETMSNRAVAHEATHLALKAAETKFNIDGWINTLKSHPDWKKLKTAVEAVFAIDPEYLDEGGRKNERIVGEALAMYAAGTRHPVPEGLAGETSYKAQEEVCTVLRGMFEHPHTGFLAMLKDDLEGRTDRYLEVKARSDREGAKGVGVLLSESSKEVTAQNRLAELAKRRQIVEASDDSLDTNADAGKKAAKDDLEDAAKNTVKTPAATIELAKKVQTRLTGLSQTFPDLRARIESEGAEQSVKEEAFAALDQNMEWVSQQQNDALLIVKTIGRVRDAEQKLEGGTLSAADKMALHAECLPEAPNPYANLTEDSTEEEIAAADAKFAENRKTLLDIANEVLTQTERMAERIEKAANTPQEQAAMAGQESSGIMDWMRKNVWGPDSGIVWITPLNIMNIIKIYKEAIKENYLSNQRVKENRFAKDINFYQPIEHTLKKQARSSNEKETSEFKEYIEREGFTFNEVFGADGKGLSTGLLAQNRHNFNRAKAVLQYAADHAWLYFMDPLHGHDVYGIDYETYEGHQSFEELVNKHEAGKSHQIDHGRERVDKYPDVPPIMDAMVHELRHKNIFAVQGIMKRLQEKAKYSHSNTWMLTTLLMLIRDESKTDPTLKLCLDKGMIDNISNFTITQSSWSITWLKVNRNAIEKWKLGKEEFGNNATTKAMELIEAKLKAAGCNFPDTSKGKLDKYEAIAMVMAGKTFSADNDEARQRGLFNYGVPKTPVSLFQADKVFEDYRQAFRDTTASTDTEPGDTDSDYFNPRNGGSDLMLLDASQTSRILSRKSTSEWTYDSKARGYVTQVLIRYDELEKTDPGAFAVFKNEMRTKFDYCMDGVWDKSRRPTVVKDTDLQGNNMVDQLASRGLLSESKIKELSAADLRPSIVSAKRVPMQPMG